MAVSFLPNLITLGNLLCGIYALLAAWGQRPFFAMNAVFLGMILDYWDGKVARRMNSVSAGGRYLDSIADALTFGISPVVIVYFLCPLGERAKLIIPLVFYVGSGIFRLWRYTFNAEIRHKELYVGLPIPGAAGAVLSPLAAWLALGGDFPVLFVSGLVLLAAFLMASRIPYPHFSKISEMFSPLFKRTAVIIFVSVSLLGQFYLFTAFCFIFYVFLTLKWISLSKVQAGLQKST